MNATKSQMSKYLALWHSRGADTLSFSVKPAHVFQPTVGQQQMEQLKQQIDQANALNNQRLEQAIDQAQ